MIGAQRQHCGRFDQQSRRQNRAEPANLRWRTRVPRDARYFAYSSCERGCGRYRRSDPRRFSWSKGCGHSSRHRICSGVCRRRSTRSGSAAHPMKIKLDENLPLRLASVLKNLGHDVYTTRDEGLSGHADRDIWVRAQEESRFLITQDLDFSDSRVFASGSHCGILLVRLHSPSRRNLIERVSALFEYENVDDWATCFIVATERKLRVLRPPSRVT